MATDPVCQMEIEEANAASKTDHNGSTYHFCSEGCATRFEKDPDSYLKD